ncbi:MAG: inverse autotransporter beta-barrel protein [Chthoniobacteraceae bacterium]|nr:inverse autotransporter beta-barrel protein [Chthoniobacteraceae bacterium]
MLCYPILPAKASHPVRFGMIGYAAGMLALGGIAPAEAQAQGSIFSSSVPEPRGFFNQSKFAQTEVGLEADFTDDANAFGLRIDQPYLINPRTVIIGELYGAKGDQGFGILSGGIAVRRILTDSGLYIGGNLFYDALQDSDGFSYSQIGVGAEVSKDWLTLRANAYLPVGDSDDVRTERRHFTRTRRGTVTDASGLILPSVTTVRWTDTSTTRRSAAWSWDAELEAAIPHSPVFFDPRIAVGFYQVHGNHGFGDYAGVKVRGEVRFGSHVVTEVEWRQDSEEIGQEWRGRIRFEFLLGRASPSEIAVARTSSGSGGNGKSVRALDYKQVETKELVPPETYPRGFFERVRRTPWPQVVRTNDRHRNPGDPKVRVFPPPPVVRPPVPPRHGGNDCGGTGTNGGCPPGTN